RAAVVWRGGPSTPDIVYRVQPRLSIGAPRFSACGRACTTAKHAVAGAPLPRHRRAAYRRGNVVSRMPPTPAGAPRHRWRLHRVAGEPRRTFSVVTLRDAFVRWTEVESKAGA